MSRRFNQHGQALVGTLVAAALVGLVGVQLVSFYETLQRENRAMRTHVEAANLTRYLQNVLAQPDLCDSALIDQGGHKIQWAPGLYSAKAPTITTGTVTTLNISSATVNRVRAVNNATVRTNPLVARIGQIFSPLTDGFAAADGQSATTVPGSFQITDMYLRRSYRDLDVYARADGHADYGSGATFAQYDTVNAKLVIQYQYCTQQSFCDPSLGAPPATRHFNSNSTTQTIDLIVSISKDGSNRIDHCHQPTLNQIDGVMCGPGPNQRLYSGQQCPTAAPPAGCAFMYYVAGFDGTGKPQCQCQTVCQSYYQGPTGTAQHNTPEGVDIMKQINAMVNNPNPINQIYMSHSGPDNSSYGSTGSLLSIGSNKTEPPLP